MLGALVLPAHFVLQNERGSPLRGGRAHLKNIFMSKKTIFLFIFWGILFLPLTSSAAGLVPCGGNAVPSCQLCHFFVMFDNIVDFIMLTLVPIVAVLMLVIGGVMFFLATGNPSALSQAKSVITTTILGLIIVYAAWIIVNMFFVVIGVADTSFGIAIKNWFTIDCPL